MYKRSCIFVRISTVLLIHEIAFSGCDLLKTKSPNRLAEPHIDGYQRKARQVPIDPSRMYLPPKIDAVASSGFGGQVDASNNFGDNINGYGEIGLNQNTYGRGSSVDGSTYESSTKATNDLNGAQTSAGPYGISTTSRSEGSSLDQSTGYNVWTPEGNNFDQNYNNNNKYNDLSTPGISSFGSSLGTKSTPSNDVTSQTESTNSYGQGAEILNTAQSQGILQSNYNKLTGGRTFSQNTGVREQYNQGINQNTAKGYSDIDSDTLKTSLQNSSKNGDQYQYNPSNNGKFDSSENQQFSGNNQNNKNPVPNSLNQKPTIGVYNPISNGDDAGYSYNRPSIGFNDFSTPNLNNQNNPSKSTSQINNSVNNENYSQYGVPSTQNFQAGEYNQGATSTLKYEQSSARSNQGILSSPQSYAQNVNEKSNTDTYFTNTRDLSTSYGVTLQNNNEFKQNPTNSYNQKPTETYQNQIGGSSFTSSPDLNPIGGNNKLQPGTSYNSYSQSSQGNDKFDQRTSSNYETGYNLNIQSSTQKYNNYGQSGNNVFQNKENYGQNVHANNKFNNQGSSSNSIGRPNQGQQNQQAFNNYEHSDTQSHVNEDNFVQSLSNSPTNGGQSQLGTQQISNNYSQTGSQPFPPSSGNYGQSNTVPSISGSYTQGSSYGPGSSQSYETNNVGGPNYLNRGNSINNPQLGAISQGISTPLPQRNRYAQTHETRNSLLTIIGGQSSSQGNSGSSSNYGRRKIGSCALLCSKIIGRNSLANSASTGSSANSGSGDRSQKKIYSTLVPKGQYQNSNMPSQGDSEKFGKGPHNNGNYGEPGSNAFSNFAPDSLPNQPQVNNDQPGYNSFSNFAPNNSPNQPPANDDQPGANAFSNFAPGSLPNQPETNSDQAGANAFSNFAPDNLPSQPQVNNDQAGANAFSNFAPGNLPSQPQVNNDQPGPNAFSNFAPGSLPNLPQINNDQPGYNSFSNFTPNNSPNQPPVNNDQPGANAFSNFAPGNLPNQPPINNDEPGPNAFSNFAPGNQPNQPPPSNSVNGSNCGKNSAHVNNANKQTEAVFSNVGY